MRAGSFVVVEVRFQDAPKASLIQHDDVIQALATNRSDQSLDIRILPGRLRRGQNLPDAKQSCRFRESLAVASVAIPQQVPRSAIPWKSFEQLMSYPFSGGVFRHRNVHRPTPIVRQDHENKQHAKEYSWNHKEI